MVKITSKIFSVHIFAITWYNCRLCNPKEGITKPTSEIEFIHFCDDIDMPALLPFYYLAFLVRKLLKQVEYESARRKRHVNEKQEKEMRKALHFFYVHLPQGTQGNSMFFKGSARRSNGRKTTQKKGQRGKISQMTEKRENIEALYERLNMYLEHTVNSN